MEHKLAWTMTLATQIVGEISQQTREALKDFTDEVGGLEQSDQLLVQIAYGLDPEPLRLAHVFKRVPYANPAVFRQHLVGAVERGWLTCEGESAYGLSEKGEIYVDELLALAEDKYEEILFHSGFAEESMTHLLEILELVDMAMADQAGVAEKHAWKLAHIFDNDTASPLYRLRRSLICLLAFRDDAHVAAWAPHALEGYVWEAFSQLRKQQTKDAKTMAAQLVSRNYVAADYQRALKLLKKRRWVCETDAGYTIAEKGMILREDVEVLTNQTYAAAFETMSVHDLVEMEGLLEALAEALTLEPVLA